MTYLVPFVVVSLLLIYSLLLNQFNILETSKTFGQFIPYAFIIVSVISLSIVVISNILDKFQKLIQKIYYNKGYNMLVKSKSSESNSKLLRDLYLVQNDLRVYIDPNDYKYVEIIPKGDFKLNNERYTRPTENYIKLNDLLMYRFTFNKVPTILENLNEIEKDEVYNLAISLTGKNIYKLNKNVYKDILVGKIYRFDHRVIKINIKEVYLGNFNRYILHFNFNGVSYVNEIPTNIGINITDEYSIGYVKVRSYYDLEHKLKDIQIYEGLLFSIVENKVIRSA